MNAADLHSRELQSTSEGERPPRRIGRVTALALVVCGLVHLAGAIEHWQTTPFLAVMTALVAVSCAHCVPALWNGPGAATWTWVTLGSGAMLSLHLAMMVEMQGMQATVGTHHHMVSLGDPARDWVGPMLITGLLLPVACLALVWRATSQPSCVRRIQAPPDGRSR